MPNALLELWTHIELGWTTHLWILSNIREVRAALLLVFNHVTRRSIVVFTLTTKKSHNTRYYTSLPPTQIFLNHCFPLLLGITVALRETEHTWYSYKFLWGWQISCVMASSLDHGHSEIANGKKNSQNLQEKRVLFPAERKTFYSCPPTGLQWSLLSTSNITQEYTKRGLIPHDF